jgi:hypothetical protein
VELTVLGIPCLGLNGGPEFRHSEAFSFQIATDNQEETDRWNAIVGNGGKESQCGWCKDRLKFRNSTRPLQVPPGRSLTLTGAEPWCSEGVRVKISDTSSCSVVHSCE